VAVAGVTGIGVGGHLRVNDSPERIPLVTKDIRSNLSRAFRASGCSVCGIRYPECDWDDLHIDHIDEATKSRRTVASGHSGGFTKIFGSSSMEACMAELLKCQVLCSKHHKGPEGKHGRNGNAPEIAAEQLPLFDEDQEWRSGRWKYA
jgi:hypothetical protein